MQVESRLAPEFYRPGPYWEGKASRSEREIRKFGLSDFRGHSNSIGTSFTDNAFIDIRGEYNNGFRATLSIVSRNLFPFSRLFNRQVALTKEVFNELVRMKNQFANTSELVNQIIDELTIPNDTIRGGCVDYCEINGQRISNHYLSLLDIHRNLAKHINFKSARSFGEIGGGFGVNVHLLIENYKNVRKIVYLDIAPNLYVGTQYLKSFYGESVKDYTVTKNLSSIEFQPGNELEILCILPYQIERLNVSLDIFQNSHSFVEMPKNVVANYAKHIERLMSDSKSAVGLVSYDMFDINSTFHPDSLPDHFRRNFQKFKVPMLWNPQRVNYFYVSS